MNKAEFMEGIHILQDSYNTKFSREKLSLYYENLKEMSKERYLENIKRLIKTSKFIPNIAEILDKKVSNNYSNYEQRNYEDVDLNKFYSNKGVINI